MSTLRGRVLAAATQSPDDTDSDFETLATGSLIAAYDRMFPAGRLQPRTDLSLASGEGEVGRDE